MSHRPPYPFTAIVGQERMKLALLLNAISSSIGGVVIRGERGTAKSTAARALSALLPAIEVVADCPFACDPRVPEALCDNCRARLADGEPLRVSRRRTAFVNLPVSATEDRVVGTLDIERAIQHGERRFEPGVLAAANRGLLYIDEVNLLDDHVVDLLLDAAALGVNVVEREGISFSHPARFILVGTMNPEEGELRPQLLDRFALCVEIRGITDPRQRVAVVERRIAYEQDPAGFYREWLPKEEALSQKLIAARDCLARVECVQRDLLTIAQLAASFKVDGHRADIVMLKTARAYGALAGRSAIAEQDIVLAAELALPHRLKRQSFEGPALEPGEIADRLREIRRQNPPDATAATHADSTTANTTETQSRAETPPGAEQTGSARSSMVPDVVSYSPGATPTGQLDAPVGASYVELAQRALQHIPAGGKTPLSAALLLAHQVCMAARRRDPEVPPLIIFLTDGAGNVSLGGLPAQEEVWQMADMLHQSHLRAIVLNMEHPGHDIGLPDRLARALGGLCYTLPELSTASLVRTVQVEAGTAGR